MQVTEALRKRQCKAVGASLYQVALGLEELSDVLDLKQVSVSLANILGESTPHMQYYYVGNS